MLSDMSWLTRLGFVASDAAASGDEAALLARLADGDADALALLYRRESGSVYRYALALAGDEAAALDAVQEAFAQLLRGPQAFNAGRGTLGAYLAGMARHQLLNQWRDARRHLPRRCALHFCVRRVENGRGRTFTPRNLRFAIPEAPE